MTVKTMDGDTGGDDGGKQLSRASLVVGIFANFCPLLAFDS